MSSEELAALDYYLHGPTKVLRKDWEAYEILLSFLKKHEEYKD